VRDWEQPTPEMQAALQLARRCTDRRGLSQADAAERIMTASSSLWYLQAGAWAEDAPPEVEARLRPLFQEGCATIVRIVDLGYDVQAGRWWPVRALYPTEDSWAGALLTLMDTGMLLKYLPYVMRETPGDVFDGPALANGFGLFLNIICGPRWEQRHRAMLQAARQPIGAVPHIRRRR
jgi:hypothetical protein